MSIVSPRASRPSSKSSRTSCSGRDDPGDETDMRRPRKAINQINVVPYIDVMLVLLVIFMVTAPLITPGQIELPSVGSKLAIPVAPLQITLRANQDIMLRDGGSEVKVSRDDLIA